jgi:hypothetical protein
MGCKIRKTSAHLSPSEKASLSHWTQTELRSPLQSTMKTDSVSETSCLKNLTQWTNSTIIIIIIMFIYQLANQI